jgi:hypothetical protein
VPIALTQRRAGWQAVGVAHSSTSVQAPSKPEKPGGQGTQTSSSTAPSQSSSAMLQSSRVEPRPSSTMPSQSSSTRLQLSMAVTFTVARASSQSVPQAVGPLQQLVAGEPSPSPSGPSVVGSQSSSTPSASQISVAPG